MNPDIEVFMPRPGVVKLRSKTGEELPFPIRHKMVGAFCQDCFTVSEKALGYMVADEVWKRLVPEDGLLCRKCLVKRNGGPVEIHELRPVQCGSGNLPDAL